jgi:chemotaxis protein CheX
MIDDLDDLVKSAVSEVFSTMLSLTLQAQPPGSEIANGEPHVASAVGFVGRLTGVVYVYSTASFARQITGRMLGISEAEIEGEDMVNDAMGELANMVVGHLKSRLADRGMACVLTVPSIVRGSHFTVEAVSTTARRVASFLCNDRQQLVIETLIKPFDAD